MPDPRSPSDPPGRAGWRSKPKAASPGSHAAKAGGWAKKADTGVERTVMRYRTKVFMGLALFVALIVVFVVRLIWQPIWTPFIAVTALNYQYPLPPNAWASEDAKHLKDLQGKRVINYNDEVKFDSNESWLKQLCRQFETAKPGGPRKNVLVIYLSMHGAVNKAGEPCLIPPGISPLDGGKWLPVADLLDALFPADKPERRDKNLKKLLILDANRMDLNWNIGLLYNTFADGLQKVVKEKDIPGLAVLNSSSPGQIGWAAAEKQDSIFGYFLWQGLSGAADDKTQGGDGDANVSLHELFGYLKARISQWVTENRAGHQTPMLILPDAADFLLVHALPQKEREAVKAANLRDPRWGEVNKLWRLHATLRDKQVWRIYPQEWEELQQGLLRLEQLLQAGSAYRSRFDEAKEELQSLAESLAKGDADRDLAAFSLPLARSLGKGPGKEELKNLSVPWKKISPLPLGEGPGVRADSPTNASPANSPPNSPPSNPPTKPGDKDAKAGVKEEKEKKPPPEPAPPADVRHSYLVASAAAWDRALNDLLSREKLVETLGFVDRAENHPETDLVEIQFLRMLENYLDPLVWQNSPQSIRQAILARNLAESAAAPADERAFYWIFPQVDRGDELRREAEDRLFVGSETALNDAENRWEKAAKDKIGVYSEAKARADKIADAYRLRDRAFSEIPYLARWILSSTGSRPALEAQLRAAIDTSHKLGGLLDAWEVVNSAGDVSAAAGALKGRLDNLETAYVEECARLRTAGEDKQKLPALLNVLAVPLVTGEERVALRVEYHNTIAKNIESSEADYRVAVEEKAAKNPAGEKVTESAAYLERLQSWNVHPALLALESGTAVEDQKPESPSTAEPKARSPGELIKQFSLQGEEIRKLLLGEREAAEKQLAETIRLIKIGVSPLPAPGVIRKPLSLADRAVRAAAPLQGRPLWGEPKNNPLRRLQDLDRHNLLLWQARRMLDDFWGPKKAGGQPYFEMAAGAYLKSAEELFKEDIALSQGEFYNLIEVRRQAAKLGLQMEKPDPPPLDNKDPSVELSLAVSAPAGFPPGEAAVYLQSGGDDSLFPVSSKRDLEKPDRRRLGDMLDRNTKSKSLDFWILNDDRLRATPELTAVAYYRGYLSQRKFFVEPSEGVDIDWKKPDYPKPTITVSGDTRQTSNLMFIFDCSGSMRTKDVVSSDKKELSFRFDAARNSLETILSQLMNPQNPYRIGLWAYGHRLQGFRYGTKDIFKTPKPNSELSKHPLDEPLNEDDFELPPPNFNFPFKIIHSDGDIELIHPLGPFSDKEYGYLKARLDALAPLGQTPLYLTISKALDGLKNAELHSARHIIVLTDGLNEQTGGGDPEIYITPEKLRDKFASPAFKDVKLDVMGINIAVNSADDREKLAKLKELIHDTAGTYYSVNDFAGMIDALEKSLGLVKYQILRNGKPILNKPLDLNSIAELDKPIDPPIDYRVQLAESNRPAQADVAVEGGEALKLFVKESPNFGRRQLVHRRYDKDLCDPPSGKADGSLDPIYDLPAPGDAKKRSFFLGAHLPDPTRGGAKFLVSVQNADAEQFSPRPAEIWVEIAPLPKGSSELPAYIFYDRYFKPGQPAPLMEFFAPKWPLQAQEAEIRLWCKLEETPPSEKHSVAELRGKTLQLENVPRATFELKTQRGATASDPFQVIVTERHPRGSDWASSSAAVKVEMAPSPESIKRRYNSKAGKIEHTFFYDGSAAAEADGYQVLFTRKQELMKNAIAVPPDRPLKVRVPRE